MANEDDLEAKIASILKRVEQGILKAEEAQILINAARKKHGRHDGHKSHGIRNFFLTMLGIGAIAGAALYYYKDSVLKKEDRQIEEYKQIRVEQEEQRALEEEVFQEKQEPEEQGPQGPQIYGIGEWAQVGNLSYKVNNVTVTTWIEGDLWNASDKIEGISSKMGPEWYEAYSKFLVVNVTARSLEGEQEVNFDLPLDIDGNEYKMKHPIGDENTLGLVLYGVLNRQKGEYTLARVTEHTPVTRDLAYEIERGTTGDSRYGKFGRIMPKGIVRLKLDRNTFIEIGDSENW